MNIDWKPDWNSLLQSVVLLGQLAVFLMQTKILKHGEALQKDVNRAIKRTPIITERAYVMLESLVSEYARGNPDEPLVLRIKPSWKNYGRTPGKRIHGEAHFIEAPITDGKPATSSIQIMRNDAFPRKAGFNLAPGETSTFASFDIGMATLRKIKDGEKKLFVYGITAYNDVFDDTGRYYSEFCYALELREDGHSFIPVDEFTSEGETAKFGRSGHCDN